MFNLLILQFENINQIYQVDFMQSKLSHTLLYIMLESGKSTTFRKMCIIQTLCD